MALLSQIPANVILYDILSQMDPTDIKNKEFQKYFANTDVEKYIQKNKNNNMFWKNRVQNLLNEGKDIGDYNLNWTVVYFIVKDHGWTGLLFPVEDNPEYLELAQDMGEILGYDNDNKNWIGYTYWVITAALFHRNRKILEYLLSIEDISNNIIKYLRDDYENEDTIIPKVYRDLVVSSSYWEPREGSGWIYEHKIRLLCSLSSFTNFIIKAPESLFGDMVSFDITNMLTQLIGKWQQNDNIDYPNTVRALVVNRHLTILGIDRTGRYLKKNYTDDEIYTLLLPSNIGQLFDIGISPHLIKRLAQMDKFWERIDDGSVLRSGVTSEQAAIFLRAAILADLPDNQVMRLMNLVDELYVQSPSIITLVNNIINKYRSSLTSYVETRTQLGKLLNKCITYSEDFDTFKQLIELGCPISYDDMFLKAIKRWEYLPLSIIDSRRLEYYMSEYESEMHMMDAIYYCSLSNVKLALHYLLSKYKIKDKGSYRYLTVRYKSDNNTDMVKYVKDIFKYYE